MMNLQLFSPRFKAGFTLAFMLCAFAAFGQYPTQPNKIALGRQTTGDGLIFRTSEQPNWTPSTVFNAWMAIDTTTGNMWTYREGAWFLEVAGDLKVDYPKVINKSGVNILRGQVVMVDTVQLVQGDQVRIRPAIATMSNSQFVMGVATEDIPNDSTGYITWFGYVREVDHDDIAQTGVTLDIGDILYISATQAGRYTDTEPAAPNVNSTMALVVRKPNANNMTLLVRPWLNEKLGDLRDVDLSGIANGQGISWDSVNRKFIPATFGSGSVTSIATNDGITGGTITTSGTIGLTGQALALHNVGGTGFFTRGAGGSIALRSIDAGTGISISDASGLSGNPTITNSAPDQTVVLTAGTGISTSGTYPNFTITNSAPDQTVSMTGAGINAVTGTYPNFTITATELDGSITNEGVLGVGAGSANTAVINSNTSGATGVTINGGVGALVTETTSSNGGTINVLVDTANIVSKTFLTNQGYTSNAGTVTSIATGYGLDGGTITTTGTLSVDTLEIATPYDVSLKQDKLTGTGLVKSTGGTISYITDNSANWNAAYNDRITSAAFSGSGTKTLSLSQQDGGAVTASFTDLQGVTSITAGVGLSGGTITTSGTIAADTTTVLASKTWVQTRGYLTSEVDGSVSNEGVLGVGAGGDNTATITSNTSGANGVTVSGGVGVFISESTSSNGGTITARIDTANIVTKTFLSNQAYTSNTGTVTSIATNNGITGGTITTTGTIGLTGNALGLHQLASNGMLARTGAGAIAARTITAGTGISVSNGDGVSGNPTITNSAPDQTVALTAGTGISTSGSYPNFTITNSAPDQTVSITGAGINSVTGTYPNFTITATEVDGSTTNEGTLGVGAGGANTAVITSNTSGASGVTIAGGTNVTITESTSSNGGTITVNASGGDSGWFKFLNNYATPTESKPMKFSGSDSLYIFANSFSDTNYLAMSTAYLSDSIDVSAKRYDLLLDIDMSLVSSVARLADSTAALRAAFPTARNINPAGEGIYRAQVGKELQFKKLLAGSNITLTGADSTVTIATTNAGTVTSIATNNGITGGTITSSGTIGLTGQALALHNLSTNGLIARTGAGTVAGRTITAGTGISVSNGDGVSGNPTITNSAPDQTVALTAGTGISTSGTYPNFTIANSLPEATTARNINATGEGVYRAEVGNELQFKRLVAGSNITLTGADSTITIASTASGSGTVKGTGAANKVAIWASADSLYQNTNLHWDNTNGRLGIGITSPIAKLHAEADESETPIGNAAIFDNFPNISANSSDVFVGSSSTLFTPIANTYNYNILIGHGARAFHRGSGNVEQLRGLNLVARHQGSGIVSNMWGANFDTFHENGKITNLMGVRSQVITFSAADTLQNLYGIYTLLNSSNSETVNAYGVYVDNLIGNNPINPFYNFYGANNALNYFNGKTGLGVTSPQNRLDVEGGAAIGATYSGTSTAPTNGLLVEGRVGIGSTLGGSTTNKFNVNGNAFIGSALVNAAQNGLTVQGKTSIGGGDTTSVLNVYGSISRGLLRGVQTPTYTVALIDSWIRVDYPGTCELTLPNPTTFAGREIMISTITANTVISNASNVVPITGGAAGTAILPATDGAWCTLVSDGSNWVIMQRG